MLGGLPPIDEAAFIPTHRCPKCEAAKTIKRKENVDFCTACGWLVFYPPHRPTPRWPKMPGPCPRCLRQYRRETYRDVCAVCGWRCEY